MKGTTIFNILLAAGTTAVAAPTKRAAEFEAVTINSLSATLSDTSGSVQLSFVDPNYEDSTSFSMNWNRPGQPPADTWSDDNNYLLSFPAGVDEIEQLSFVVKRYGASETISVAVNNESEDSVWTCGPLGGVPGTQRCYAAAQTTITPTSS
ncbi:hypothetical protein N7456_006315 [Penicillium angulare]|uniref:Cell wall beta-glucan synthesis n=1 Tax=Penicillium angulare TaxID=116970 RepID=A0A9W9FHJ9_9EURO|nr:hypothetical protein N7456_006315 [Penicillium angulare]